MAKSNKTLKNLLFTGSEGLRQRGIPETFGHGFESRYSANATIRQGHTISLSGEDSYGLGDIFNPDFILLITHSF